MANSSKMQVCELTVQVMAAELNLTLFANRYGKDSDAYQDSLRDFAIMWRRLRNTRRQKEFHKDIEEVKAS